MYYFIYLFGGVGVGGLTLGRIFGYGPTWARLKTLESVDIIWRWGRFLSTIIYNLRIFRLKNTTQANKALLQNIDGCFPAFILLLLWKFYSNRKATDYHYEILA